MILSLKFKICFHHCTVGPSSQVCWSAFSDRRNHGAPHWLLFYKFRRNFIFRSQDFARVNETEENNKIMKIIYNISFIQVLCWGSEGESEIRRESIVICLLLKLILGLTRYDNNVCQQLIIEQNLNRWNKTTTYLLAFTEILFYLLDSLIYWIHCW